MAGVGSEKRRKKIWKVRKITVLMIAIAVVIVAVILAVACLDFARRGSDKDKGAEVITSSTLEQMISVSDLSTYTSVYNGVARAKDKEDPEKIDYYVAYEAVVKAGIDFEKLAIDVDNEGKLIHIALPEVEITEIDVEIESLDFIFNDDQYDASTITNEAYKLCEADVRAESSQQESIYDLARQSAINTIKALIRPIIDQLDSEYQLAIE